MITLLKNADCYCPGHIGIRDVLIAGGQIFKIAEAGKIDGGFEYIKTIDCGGLRAFPGIVDGHAHITGGGGEQGFESKIRELEIGEILSAGVTTAVGLLGADSQTRSLKELLAKAKALERQGITTFIYSGSYSIPLVTFSGCLTQDMLVTDKVIGAGEIALSDIRSSHPDLSALKDIASKAYLGGLLTGKAGLVHFHIGDGKDGLRPLNELLERSEFKRDMFLPTHINRSEELLKEGIIYAKAGGNIDLTSCEKIGVPVPDAVEILMKEGVLFERISISSDANGGMPDGGKIDVGCLYNELIRCIKEKRLSPEIIFSLATKNPARRIKQFPKKGAVREGSDADILLIDKGYKIKKVFAMGRLLIDN